jgi:hypothetical protein
MEPVLAGCEWIGGEGEGARAGIVPALTCCEWTALCGEAEGVRAGIQRVGTREALATWRCGRWQEVAGDAGVCGGEQLTSW